MAYLHIPNYYKDNSIQLFRECYALEKIHGTSAHLRWKPATEAEPAHLHLFSGEMQAAFEQLFDARTLAVALAERGGDITIFGECYGGKIQKQSERYGAQLRFVAFDVKINDRWLCVPEACGLVQSLGLEFVHHIRTSTETAELNALRDAPSVQAARNGCGTHTAEGIVLRPLVELQNWRGERVIAKHKRDDFRETFQPRRVGETPQVLVDAETIAGEWVTPMRMQHVLQRLPAPHTIAQTSEFIGLMLEDVLREAAGEIVDSRPARKAIAAKAAIDFKKYLQLPALEPSPDA